MGVWALLLTLVGWILVGATVLAVVAFLVGFGLYLARAIKAARARSKSEPATVLSDEAIKELAEDHLKGSLDIFGHNEAFMRGTEFALAAKRGDNANSI